MKQTAFRPYDLRNESRKTLKVSRFLGVDLTSSKFQIANGRAIDALNYVYKDGSIQKRNGFEEIGKVESLSYIPVSWTGTYGTAPRLNPVHFNGIWRFLAEDGKHHIVAHIGRLLYEIKNVDNGKPTFEPMLYSISTVYAEGEYHKVSYEYEDYKSFAFVGGNKLWFLGGNKLMCIRFLEGDYVMVFPAEDSDMTPIPVTTQSITYKNAISSGRMSLDKVNLLQTLRKNKLISGVGKEEDDKTATDFFDYTLDSPIVCKDEARDMANFSMTIEERGTIE